MLLNVPLYQIDIPTFGKGHVYGVCYQDFNQGLMAIQRLRGDGDGASSQMEVQIWLLSEGK